MLNESIISGERLEQLCDVYCGSEYDLNRNPIIASQKDKHMIIDRVHTEWDNPRLIFCYSCALSTLMNKLQLIKNKFILVSHNEDDNITEKYLSIANSPLVIKWFAQNIMINHSKVHLLPIGIANTMWQHGNIDNLIHVKKLNLDKEDKIYFYFNTHTNSIERELCKSIVQSKGIQFGYPQSYDNYLIDLSKCKFAICPPGNGIDCHRTWECYYMNVIPILLRSIFTENLNNILPCILLNNWDEFNYNEIIDKYDELIVMLEKNKQYIDFRYYKELIVSSLNNNKSTFSIIDYDNLKSFSLTDSKNIPIDFKLDSIINKTNGFYIELGANNGLEQSNTAFFEFNRGWKGILVEPSLSAYNECTKNRSNSICYNYACVANDYQNTEIRGDFNGNLMSSIDGNRLHSNNIVSVKTTTLENLLDINNISNIDLLSLDTEGYELNILKGLNLTKYHPRYMLIEIYNRDYNSILNFLEQYNYILVSNFTNYNKLDNPHWDETHNDYLFKYIL